MTGTAGLEFRPDDSTLTYVKYSRGYKAGGFGANDTFTNFTPLVETDKELVDKCHQCVTDGERFCAANRSDPPATAQTRHSPAAGQYGAGCECPGNDPVLARWQQPGAFTRADRQDAARQSRSTSGTVTVPFEFW